MVDARTVKKILRAVAEAHPASGPTLLHRLDLMEGWGDMLIVRLHATVSPQADLSHEARRLRNAVQDAIGERRRQVEIVWDGSI